MNDEHVRFVTGTKDDLIPWKYIKNYLVIENNQSILANFYSIVIRDRKGKRHLFNIVDDRLVDSGGNINPDSVLSRFCGYVKNYNSSMTVENDNISLEMNFGARRAYKYLLIIPVALLLIDVFLRIRNPAAPAARREFGLFVMCLILILSMLAKRKSNSSFYEKVFKLQEGEH